MTLVVDPWHWLTPEGDIPADPPRLRRKVLRVARVVEYGATLPSGHFRPTRIVCIKRPAGIACQGLLWVEKRPDESILAVCPACQTDHILVHNWQDTRCSQGQVQAVSEPPVGEEKYF